MLPFVDRRPAGVLTYGDYLRFPDDERWELIDGVAHMVAAPNPRHQAVLGRLHLRAGAYLEARPELGRLYFAPLDVVLTEHDVVQPDLVFVADTSIITEKNVWGTPTWVVEIVSDPRRDRVLKLRAYARTGVPEYWIVDPVGDTIDVFLPAPGGGYAEPRRSAPGHTISPRALPGLAIEVADVLRRDR